MTDSTTVPTSLVTLAALFLQRRTARNSVFEGFFDTAAHAAQDRVDERAR